MQLTRCRMSMNKYIQMTGKKGDNVHSELLGMFKFVAV